MSFTEGTTKEEVMTWDPEKLADYVRRLKLFCCDNVVLKRAITGAQFMQMKQHELAVFPVLYVPILAKIQRDLNKQEMRKGFGSKSKTQGRPEEVQGENVWDQRELVSENDNEYEKFNPEAAEGNYIVALTEPHTADNLHNARAGEDHRVKAIVSHRLKMPEPQKPSKVLYRPTAGGAVAVATGSLTSRRPPPVVPQRNVPNRANNQVARVPALIQHTRSDLSVRTSRQGLDPRWYRGRITRNQAEVSLWEVNKDGAFLVRDSSHSSTQHPYTLMLLKQGKIYNIKIQRQNDFYFLGNGVNNIKRFLGVKEMIVHHMNTPLLLIDATHQSSEEQCCLLHPAGL